MKIYCLLACLCLVSFVAADTIQMEPSEGILIPAPVADRVRFPRRAFGGYSVPSFSVPAVPSYPANSGSSTGVISQAAAVAASYLPNSVVSYPKPPSVVPAVPSVSVTPSYPFGPSYLPSSVPSFSKPVYSSIYVQSVPAIYAPSYLPTTGIYYPRPPVPTLPVLPAVPSYSPPSVSSFWPPTGAFVPSGAPSYAPAAVPSQPPSSDSSFLRPPVPSYPSPTPGLTPPFSVSRPPATPPASSSSSSSASSASTSSTFSSGSSSAVSAGSSSAVSAGSASSVSAGSSSPDPSVPSAVGSFGVSGESSPGASAAVPPGSPSGASPQGSPSYPFAPAADNAAKGPCHNNYLFSCQPKLTPVSCAPLRPRSMPYAGAHSHHVPQYTVPVVQELY